MKKTYSPSPRRYQFPIAHGIWMGLWVSYPFMLTFWLAWSCAGFKHAVQVLWCHLSDSLSRLILFHYCGYLLTLAIIVFWSSFCDFWALRRGMVWMNQLDLRTSQSHVLCILISCGSLLVAIYFKKKFLCWGLDNALTCGYKGKDLWDSLIVCQFSRIIVGFPLWSMTLASYESWTQPTIHGMCSVL